MGQIPYKMKICRATKFFSLSQRFAALLLILFYIDKAPEKKKEKRICDFKEVMCFYSLYICAYIYYIYMYIIYILYVYM